MSTGNGFPAGLSSDELRAAVRAVLRDVLPPAVLQPPTGSPAAPAATMPSALSATPAPTPVAVRTEVTLLTDADLDAFVRQVAALCENSDQRAALRSGRHDFRLARARSAEPAKPAKASASVVRVERGAVTERAVKKAAADGARLVVGRRAVLTPLARDRARTLGVAIERET